MTFDPDLAKARILVSRFAMRMHPFSSDDIRELIEREGISLKVQAIGAALAEAKSGDHPYIVQIGETPSRIPTNHARKVDVYVLLNERTGRPVSQSGFQASQESRADVESPSLPHPNEQGQLVPAAESASDDR